MRTPSGYGLLRIAWEALGESGQDVPFAEAMIGEKGDTSNG